MDMKWIAEQLDEMDHSAYLQFKAQMSPLPETVYKGKSMDEVPRVWLGDDCFHKEHLVEALKGVAA